MRCQNHSNWVDLRDNPICIDWYDAVQQIDGNDPDATNRMSRKSNESNWKNTTMYNIAIYVCTLERWDDTS